MSKVLRLKRAVVALICATFLACGGDDSASGGNPAAPGSGSGSGGGSASCTSFGPLGAAKGTITATISGFGAFNGGVATGASVYTPIPAVPSLGLPAQDIFTIGGVCGDLKQLVIGARATTGTTNIGVDGSGNPLRDPQTKQPLPHSVLLTNGVAAGQWVTSLLGGSGSITVNSVSPSAASGSFSVTMIPSPGTGAVGNRTVTGQFNVTL